MNNVELLIETNKVPAEVEKLKMYAGNILKKLGIDDWQMGLLLTDNDGIRHYNRRWRGIDKPTDVLSFVQDEGDDIPSIAGVPKEAGDIVVSLETVEANSREWETSFEEELRRVVVHGILHLKGMDHHGDDYGEGMLKLQEELLADAGSLR